MGLPFEEHYSFVGVKGIGGPASGSSGLIIAARKHARNIP